MTQLNPFTLKAFMSTQPVIKALLYGEAKTGKTTFASQLFSLASKGYQIIYLDCDKSMNTIRNKPVENMENIIYVPLRDSERITIHPFIFYLLSKCDFFYNPKTGYVADSMTFIKDGSAKDFIPVYGSRIDRKTIIVCDSLTELAASMFNRLREKQGYSGLSFDMDKLYGNKVQQYYGVLATEFNELLDRLSNIDCSVFMIAHTKTIEKKDKNGNVLSSKTYPLSTTTNSSELLSKYFDETLFFSSRANNYYISSQPSADLCGVGGRLLAPKAYTAKELNMDTLLKLYGFNITEDSIHSINLFGLDNNESNETENSVLLTTNKITI